MDRSKAARSRSAAGTDPCPWGSISSLCNPVPCKRRGCTPRSYSRSVRSVAGERVDRPHWRTPNAGKAPTQAVIATECTSSVTVNRTQPLATVQPTDFGRLPVSPASLHSCFWSVPVLFWLWYSGLAFTVGSGLIWSAMSHPPSFLRQPLYTSSLDGVVSPMLAQRAHIPARTGLPALTVFECLSAYPMEVLSPHLPASPPRRARTGSPP